MLKREPGKAEAALRRLFALKGYKIILNLRGWFGIGFVAALDNRYFAPAIIARVKGSMLELQDIGSKRPPTPMRIPRPDLAEIMASAERESISLTLKNSLYVPSTHTGYPWSHLVHVDELEKHALWNQSGMQGGVTTSIFLTPRRRPQPPVVRT